MRMALIAVVLAAVAGVMALGMGLRAGEAAGGAGKVRVERVEYEIEGKPFTGYMAYPAEKGKRPSVLVVHEWWGCNEYAGGRAKMLAQAGYLAFALDMYGGGTTTQDPKKAGELAGALYADPEVLRGRARAGLKVLTMNQSCDTERLAAIGYCMGGTVALELARTGADLDATVAFHASTIAAKEPADNARIKGTVMICHGADDGFVPAGQIEEFHKQMRAAGVDYVFTAYGHAVHSFTNPGADKAGIDGVKYNEKADRRSWEAMMGLFGERFSSAK